MIECFKPKSHVLHNLVSLRFIYKIKLTRHTQFSIKLTFTRFNKEPAQHIRTGFIFLQRHVVGKKKTRSAAAVIIRSRLEKIAA